MAKAIEIPEVMVTGELIPIQEFDRVRNAVCLLKSNTKDSRFVFRIFVKKKLYCYHFHDPLKSTVFMSVSHNDK